MTKQDKRDICFLIIGNILGTLLILLFTSLAQASEPVISILHGPKPGTSIIEVQWDDGTVNTLLYHDDEISNERTGYKSWFKAMYNSYKLRSRQRGFLSAVESDCGLWRDHHCEYTIIFD